MATHENAHHQAITENINWNIQHMKELYPDYSAGEITDGYHTFNDLYKHRAHLFAALCRAWSSRAWRSKKHHDEKNDPMPNGMFIVGIDTPAGPVTYHYDIDPYWDLFSGITEWDVAPRAYDGCTPDEGLERLKTFRSLHGFHYMKIRNEFTEACDEHLLDSYMPEDRDLLGLGLGTELMVDSSLEVKDYTITIPFRFPGATRGHITMGINSCQIIDVKFYDIATMPGIGCYKESVLKLAELFKGHYFKGDSGLLIRAYVEPVRFTYWDSRLREDYGNTTSDPTEG